MDRDNPNRDKIAGFMLGVSVGVGIGLFLKPPDETRSRVFNEGTDYLKRHSDRLSSQAADRPKERERTA